MAAPKAIPVGRLTAGNFVAECTPDRLVYFLVNVGDGDTQLILLPEHEGVRSLLVVDVATTHKLPALIAALQAAGGAWPRPPHRARRRDRIPTTTTSGGCPSS